MFFTVFFFQRQHPRALNGMEIEYLVNTGSMVTLVSEAFYKEKLESVCSRVHGVGRMLTLRGANEL